MATRENVRYVISGEDKLSKVLGGLDRKTDSLDKKMLGLGKSIGFAFAGAITIGAIKTFGEAIIGATAKMEGLENAVIFASGSAEEGQKSLDFIRRTANELGTDLESSIDGFRSLSGAMLGTSIGIEQQRKIFKQMSTSVTAMNLSGDAAKGVFLALGQIMSKGKVQAEELRGQLGERIPGAFSIAARAMGKTNAELDKMLEQGKLTAEDFLPRFADEIEKTFKGALPTATKALRANLNRTKNEFLLLQQSIGKRLNPTINKTLKFTNKLTKGLKRLIEVPVSEQLEEERKRLNSLKFQINDTNLSVEGRLKLLNEIRAINPEVVAGLDAENLNYKKLNDSLDLNNEKLLNRILIQKQAEKLQKVINKQQAAEIAVIEQKAFVRDKFRQQLESFGRKSMSLGEEGKKIEEDGTLSVVEKSLALDKLGRSYNANLKHGERSNSVFHSMWKSINVLNPLMDRLKTANDKLAESQKNLKSEEIAFKEFFNIGDTELKAKITGDTKPLDDLEEVTKITSAAPKIFNINIEKLIEDFNISTTNLTEGAAEIKSKVLQAVLDALNQSQTIVT